MVKEDSKLMSNTKMRGLLANYAKRFYTHFKPMAVKSMHYTAATVHGNFDYTYYDTAVYSTMQYLQQDFIILCVKHFLTICQERLSAIYQYLNIIFDATFTSSSKDTTVCKYISSRTISTLYNL